MSSVNYHLVGRSATCSRTCCGLHGKPTRDFRGSNFRRTIRCHLVIPLWALVSKWTEFHSPFGIDVGLSRSVLNTVLSTISQMSRSSRLSYCYLFFTLFFSKHPPKSFNIFLPSMLKSLSYCLLSILYLWGLSNILLLMYKIVES